MLLNLAEHTVSVNDPRQLELDKRNVTVLKVKSIRFITMENFCIVED
jgi:DNA-binding Xre family transcriptional regulator